MEYCYTNDSAHEMEVGQVFLGKTTASTMCNVGQVFTQNATKIYQLSSGGKLILFVLYAFVLNNYFL